MPTTTAPSVNWQHLRRALTFIRPHRIIVGFIFGLTLIGTIASTLEPLLLKRIFDALSGDKPMKTVLFCGAILLAMGALKETGNAIASRLTSKARTAIHYSLLKRAVDRLHRLPESHHCREGVGALMTRMERGIHGFINAITKISFDILPAIAYIIIASLLMLHIDWRLFLVVLIFTPIPALIAARAAPEQTRREHTLLNNWAGIYARFNEVLSSITMVRSFAMEGQEQRRFLSDVSGTNDVVVQGASYDSRIDAAKNYVIHLARVASIIAGAMLVANGEATVGTIIAFMGYVSGLFGPVQTLTTIYSTVCKASANVSQVFDILDADDPVPDAPDACPPPEFAGRVCFQDVCFSYGNEEAPIIESVSLDIKAGETVALVGPSGSGKTTLMALLQRFHDPTHGKIMIDGTDVRAYEQRPMRNQIGMVLQDALLFNDTIRDNIAYGRPDAPFDEIVRVAQDAQAHDFITSLPDGYDTVIGERGTRLSVGERQRVSIARALLKDPPILIFDEATSALDAESEALIQRAFARLCHGRTTFLIAHRLSTVVDADRIIVLRGGRVVESGNHNELLQNDDYYASLVRQQTEGLTSLEKHRHTPPPISSPKNRLIPPTKPRAHPAIPQHTSAPPPPTP